MSRAVLPGGGDGPPVPPRPARRPGHRPRRRRSLRTRLVVSSVALIAIVCAVIGTVTTLALQSFLFAQLDKQVKAVATRARMDPGYGGTQQPGAVPIVPGADGAVRLRFITGPGIAPGTVGARLDGTGAVTDAPARGHRGRARPRPRRGDRPGRVSRPRPGRGVR
ncbi:hypothetical protein [Streptomyces sp. NPDC001070]